MMGSALGALRGAGAARRVGPGFWPLVSMGAILGRHDARAADRAGVRARADRRVRHAAAAADGGRGRRTASRCWRSRRSILTEKMARRGFHVTPRVRDRSAGDPVRARGDAVRGRRAARGGDAARGGGGAGGHARGPAPAALPGAGRHRARSWAWSRGAISSAPWPIGPSWPMRAAGGAGLAGVAAARARGGRVRRRAAARGDPPYGRDRPHASAGGRPQARRPAARMVSLDDMLKARVRHLEEERRRERVLPLRLLVPFGRFGGGRRREAATPAPVESPPSARRSRPAFDALSARRDQACRRAWRRNFLTGDGADAVMHRLARWRSGRAPAFRGLMPTLHFKLKSLLLVSVLPALSLACNHPSTSGNGNGAGGYETNGPGGSSAGHSGSGGTNGSAGANGRAGTGAGGSSTVSDGGADAVRRPAAAGPRAARRRPHDGMSFPFPQNRQSASCIYPTGYRNEDVHRRVQAVEGRHGHLRRRRRSLRVKRAKRARHALEPQSTVSEGIGYGMLIAVYMGDQHAVRRALEVRAAAPRRRPASWTGTSAPPDGRRQPGTGAAPDRRRRGHGVRAGDGRQAVGRQGLADRRTTSTSPRTRSARSGSTRSTTTNAQAGARGATGTVNISYFAPAYYRVFAKVDTGATHDWNDAVTSVYDTIKAR